MKISLALILSIFFGVGLVTFVFTIYQISGEKSGLRNVIETRVSQIAGDIVSDSGVFSNFENAARARYVIDSLAMKYSLKGVAIINTPDSINVNPAGTALLQRSQDYIDQSRSSGKPSSGFFKLRNHLFFHYAQPLSQGRTLVLFSDAEYISRMNSKIFYRSLFRWMMQTLLISIFTLLVIKWGIFRPISSIVNWSRTATSGKPEELTAISPSSFLAPLHKEIVRITRAMHMAKLTAEEEAMLRTKSEAIWTPERLKAEVHSLLLNRKMIVVSNREPYMHIHDGAAIKCIVPASGLITAMEPVLNACGGLWIASGTGDADRETVDEKGRLTVPPDDPKYTLRRLWLSKEEEIHYYYGFSNEGLWPLCHIAHTRPVFRMEDWLHYKKVNEDFAAAVIEETGGDEQPFILIQDYHFALLPELIRKKKPDARIAIFWHIPWPNPESFGICPWQREILRGMLGADLIGFHTQYHCNHFLETVNAALESRVAWDNFTVKMEGQTTFIKPFPISIEFTLKDYDSSEKPRKSASELLRDAGIPAQYMGIGVDRIDYTKGILEKFLSVERFLEKYPSYKGRFTFVQIGAPSRVFLKNYSDTVTRVEKEAERINNRFKGRGWKPILLLDRHHSHEEIHPYYAAADFCMVSSLHDGMNLVAKEFVATRNSNSGALILSQFTGASQELQGALVINPYDIEMAADMIKYAIEMEPAEQEQRMRQMRQAILRNNIFTWASALLRTMATLQ